MQLRFESKPFSMVSLNSELLACVAEVLQVHPFISTRFVHLETLSATVKGFINKHAWVAVL